MLWFIVLTTIMGNGDVYVSVRPALSPEYNNELICNDIGRQILIEEQKKLDESPQKGTVYYVCESISEEQFKKAIGKEGSNL